MSPETPNQFHDASELYNIPRKSLTDEVYHRLTKMITSLTIQPGSRLNLKELREVFNVSQAPLRDAVQRLVAEGLIISEPQMGYYAIKLEENDIHDLYGLRSVLEMLALEKSIDKIPQDRLSSIRAIFSNEKYPEKENSSEHRLSHSPQYKQADWDLHYNLIIGYSESQVFSQISKHIFNFFQVLWSLNISRREATTEHFSIIDAILERDLDTALTALRNHLAAAEKAKSVFLEK